MFVQVSRHIAALCIMPDHHRRHAKPHAVCIHPWWGNMIEEPSSFIIDEEESRTRPQARSDQSIDYLGHLTLPLQNVKWWVLANHGFGNEKRYPRKLTRPQIAVVIRLHVMEAGIVLPFVAKCKSVEPLKDIDITAHSQAKIVAFPAKIVLIQQVNDRWPIEAAAFDIVGRIASTCTRPESDAIGKCWPKLVGEVIAAQCESVCKRIVVV